jgi:Arc/MetJ-type ribon-helix-helix transcriptional regulator
MRTLKLRASDALIRRIDELVAARGLTNRSDAIRHALWADSAKPLDASIATRKEILLTLAERMRDGHVGAMQVLLRELPRSEPAEPQSFIDELSKRRHGGSGAARSGPAGEMP